MSETMETEMPRRGPGRPRKIDRSDAALEAQAARRFHADSHVAPTDGATVEQLQAKLKSDGLSRKARRLIRRRITDMLVEADNPFIGARPSVLPVLDWERDPEHSYHWVRTQLGADIRGDRQNLHEKSTGHLRYEFVKLDDLPEDWQAQLQAFVMDDRTISYRDVTLARCNKRMRDMRLAAQEHAADNLADKLNAEFRSKTRADDRMIGRIDEDMEESEVREIEL